MAFCLVDGSILSAPYAPSVKRPFSIEAQSDPEATQILPQTPLAQESDMLPPTIPALQFSEFKLQQESKPDKASSKQRIFVPVVVVLGALILTIGGVLLLFGKGETQGPSTSSPQRTSGTSTTGESTPSPVVKSGSGSATQNESDIEKPKTAEVPSRTASPVASQPVVSQKEKLERYEAVARKAKSALDAAQNALQEEGDKVSAAKANLDRENARLQVADRDLKRAQQLLDAKMLSEREFNRTKTRYSASQKQQANAQNLHAEAQASYRRAKERYDEAQRNFLNAQSALRDFKAEMNN